MVASVGGMGVGTPGGNPQGDHDRRAEHSFFETNRVSSFCLRGGCEPPAPCRTLASSSGAREIPFRRVPGGTRRGIRARVCTIATQSDTVISDAPSRPTKDLELPWFFLVYRKAGRHQIAADGLQKFRNGETPKIHRNMFLSRSRP